MRVRVGAAEQRRCTERTACPVRASTRLRLAAAATLCGAAAVWAACGGNAGDERAGDAARAGPRTLGTHDTSVARASAAPACPPTNAWQLCSVVERLERAGLAPRQEAGRVLESPLSASGVAFRVGRSELRVFLYADRASRERDQAKLAKGKYVGATEPLSIDVEPTLIVSENLLAILRSRNDHQRERVYDALTAGPPQKPRTRG
jgi:hypothetical protein